MRRLLLIGVCVAALAAALATWGPTLGAQQAQPRQRGEGQRTTEPRTAEPRSAEPRATPPDQRATPRPPADRQPAAPRPKEPPRAHPAPPRVVPPAYYAPPHRYYFPPVSLHRGFYYHPYFGFYYGPYYGPYYPYPGPFVGPAGYAAGAIRARVRPVDAEVYVNGYFAGLVDDFDGIFQRLYLPAGQQEIEFRLDGFETYRLRLYLQPGDTRDVVHQMRRLRAGERAEPTIVPGAMPQNWTTAPATPGGDRPASPFGILTLYVDPPDAQVLIDGEVWLGLEGRSELVIHVPAGPHQLEVRREGFQNFKTGIELSEGGSTRLVVRLDR